MEKNYKFRRGIHLLKEVNQLSEKVYKQISVIHEYFIKLGQDEPALRLEVPKPRPKEFSILEEAVPDMIAVDGSFSWLWNPQGTSIWLALIRTGAVIFSVEEVNENLGYKFVDYVIQDDIELITPDEALVQELDSLHQELLTYVGNSKIQGFEKETIALALLRYHEQRLLFEMVKKYKNVIVAVDGTLTTGFFDEFMTLMENIVRICEQNENLLIGVSKDSKLHSYSNYYVDEQYFKRIISKEPHKLYYYKIPSEIIKRNISTPLYGDVYYAQLHPYAPKWFRVDVGTYKEQPDRVFSSVAQYARSALSPGFIHPALEAHKLVVSIRQNREVYENMIYEMGTEVGFTPQEILDGITNLEGRSRGSYHEYLDIISR